MWGGGVNNTCKPFLGHFETGNLFELMKLLDRSKKYRKFCFVIYLFFNISEFW
jgi:hypothetical protein